MPYIFLSKIHNFLKKEFKIIRRVVYLVWIVQKVTNTYFFVTGFFSAVLEADELRIVTISFLSKIKYTLLKNVLRQYGGNIDKYTN